MMKYWNSKEIDKYNARYNIIVGERSNGKTTNILEKIILGYINKGDKGAILRRYENEIKGHRGAAVFTGIDERGLIEKWTNGEWDHVKYRSRKYYFAKWEEDGRETMSSDPFAYIFALNQAMRDKSNSYPGVGTIMFDEFMTRDDYLYDEFTLFQNVISTIVREKDDAKVYMLGNTVSLYCPYFEDMGIQNVREMEQGSIHTYDMWNVNKSQKIKNAIAVERTAATEGGKASDVYFGFDSQRSAMITGGSWELGTYPKIDFDYSATADVLATAFLEYKGDILRMRIIRKDDNLTLFVEEEKRPIEDLEYDIFYKLEASTNRRHFIKPEANYGDRYTRNISTLLIRDRISYGSTKAGEALNHYLADAQQFSVRRQ